MAKKQSRHSRAARRNVEETPEIEIDDGGSDNEGRGSGRTKVLEEIAIKEIRKKGSGSGKRAAAMPEGMDELTAISMGVHPEQATGLGGEQPAGRVGKPSAKKNQRNKAKQKRAEMVKDMLNEKIEQARQRHKTIRTYRTKEEEEEEEEKEKAKRAAGN